MNFIKKNYEKILLILLLTVFLVLLVYQALSIMIEKNKKPEEKLNLKPPMPDYRRISVKQDYSTLENLITSEAQLEVKKSCFVPPLMTKCPMSEGAFVHFIPVADVAKAHKCSFCGKKIAARSRIGANMSLTAAGQDSDGDGIPDADERTLGLNANDKQDAFADLDKDGFTNLEEYLARTDIRDPKSRPSYAKKLYFSAIITKSLDMKLLPYANDGEKIDPKNWEIQIETYVLDRRGKRRKRTQFVRLGDSFTIGRRRNAVKYIMDSIEVDFRYNEQSGNKENVSRLIIIRQDKNKSLRIPCEPGKEIVHPKKNVRFVLNVAIPHDKDISAFVGESFTVGNETCGVETFTLLSLSEDNSTVTIQGADGMKYEIESTKKMPQNTNLPEGMIDSPQTPPPPGTNNPAGF